MVSHSLKLYAVAGCLVVFHACGQAVGQADTWHDQIDNVDPRRDAIAGHWQKTKLLSAN